MLCEGGGIMSAMAPLFTPPTQPDLREAESMITACFESFYEAGILEAVDVRPPGSKQR